MLRLVRRLLRYRSLLITLTERDLKARYRGSVLGFFWSLVTPLTLLLVYSFVFNTIFQPRDSSVSDFGPYALFLATGVIPWIWLQSAWIEGTNALMANAGLIRKAAFPAELLPVVAVLSNLVHFLLALPILILAFVVTSMFPDQSTQLGPTALLIPVIAAIQLPLLCGLALGTAALNVHFKDVKDILANVLTLLFFMTPILYSFRMIDNFPWLQKIIASSPFTPIILGYQEVLFYGRVPSPLLWLKMILWSAVVAFIGAWIFDRLSETLVEAV